MRITFIAEDELTDKVLAGLKNNFAICSLGRSLDVLLDKDVDALAAISAVADIDWVVMVAQMNARTLSGVIVVDVEDISMTWDNVPKRLLTNFAN